MGRRLGQCGSSGHAWGSRSLGGSYDCCVEQKKFGCKYDRGLMLFRTTRGRIWAWRPI